MGRSGTGGALGVAQALTVTRKCRQCARFDFKSTGTSVVAARVSSVDGRFLHADNSRNRLFWRNQRNTCRSSIRRSASRKKNVVDWKGQFPQKLEYNVKAGVFRIIIACGPSQDNVFSYASIRN